MSEVYKVPQQQAYEDWISNTDTRTVVCYVPTLRGTKNEVIEYTLQVPETCLYRDVLRLVFGVEPQAYDLKMRTPKGPICLSDSHSGGLNFRGGERLEVAIAPMCSLAEGKHARDIP